MAIRSQIENRNFLSPTGFKFILTRAPKVSFFANTANIPSLSMGNAIQTSYLKDIPVPGDKVEFGDFTLRFIVDENLENYSKPHSVDSFLLPGWKRRFKHIEMFTFEDTKGKSDNANL